MSENTLGTEAPRTSTLDALKVYLRPSVLVVILLGFSSGLPLALTGSTLAVWMTERKVDIATIGLFHLVGLPYTLKFLWAPLVDAIDVPLLSRWLGRRRGWLLATQILLAAAILYLGFQDLGFTTSADGLKVAAPFGLIVGSVLVAFLSATQDIVVDAYRVEKLDTSEQAAGMAGYVAAYRIGMLVSGAGIIAVVTWLEFRGLPHDSVWAWGYGIAAACMGLGILATLIAREPDGAPRMPHEGGALGTMKRVFTTAYGAFSDFLTRNQAVAILAFVTLYKFSDALAGGLTASFIISIGFDKAVYAGIVKGVGLAATLVGGFAGGMLARGRSLVTCLWIGGVLQMLSNLAFSVQAMIGPDVAFLTFAMVVENFTSAIGTVIFVAYLSSLCGVRAHTATQYALLTALTAVGRTVLASGGGYIYDVTGWAWFFVITVIAGIPGLMLLAWLQARGHFRELAKG
ncbi:MFS transporter [Azorhizobium oxalatiphilum]|uniref:MFS transporter n=1 Tax=Azorhizobium oxalatiphilum TaxID=980631 RepID=A0A917C849_9HYPH|nr:MFS transporter [Azorhizobium oxalatiphilum]GGF77192.1 MFS transporter [Azorhizobium oxalatiphilum]